MKLTMTIEISGNEFPVTEAAGQIDAVIEKMGKVEVWGPDGSPKRVSGKLEGIGAVAIVSKSKEER